MDVPKLTVEHIEYATNIQISRLLNTDPSTTSHWLKRNFNLGSLKVWYTCVDLETLASGFLRRRHNSQRAKRLQKEFDEILANSEKLEEPSVA